MRQLQAREGVGTGVTGLFNSQGPLPAPTLISTDHGIGSSTQTVAGDCCSVGERCVVAAAALILPPSFPIPRTRLIGRETERASARAFLLGAAVPLLALTGPGGVGKTRLALAIAQDMAEHGLA